MMMILRTFQRRQTLEKAFNFGNVKKGAGALMEPSDCSSSSEDDEDSKLEKKRGINQSLNVFKAGLQDIDTDSITAKIQEASKVR